MIEWNEIESRIENFEKLRKLDKQATARLLAEFPGIPSDYISFLEEIGFGNLAPSAREPGMANLILFNGVP